MSVRRPRDGEAVSFHPAAAALAALSEAPAAPGRRLVAAPRQAIRLPGPARRVRWRLASFVAIVVLPAAVAAWYYFAVAAELYVAEFRFALRSAVPEAGAPSGLLSLAGTSSPIATDSQIVAQYIASRAIVDALGRSLDLRRIFTRPEADRLARLPLPVSIEGLVRYWRSQVESYFEPTEGTIVVRVRAFRAADALAIADGIRETVATLVNDLSARARDDALRQSQETAAAAKARLETALARLRDFRDRTAVVDPNRAAAATGTLAAQIRDALLKTEAERTTLRRTMSATAPSVTLLDARIAALEEQWHALNAEITAATPAQSTALSREMSRYDALEDDRKFAETAYQHALADLDRARRDAARRAVYVVSFVPPRLPEQPLYPRRWHSLGLIAFVAFAVWAIGGLVLQSVRDHL